MIIRFIEGQRITKSYAFLWITGILFFATGFSLMNYSFWREVLIGTLFMIGSSIIDEADEQPK